MSLSYEMIRKFMDQYCKDYSEWVNDPCKFSSLDKYYSHDFQSIAYMHLKETPYPFILTTRDEFKAFLQKGHQRIVETLVPVEMVIDEKMKKVVMLLRIEKREKGTGSMFVSDAMALYDVSEDDEGAIRLSSLKIFTDDAGKLTQWVKAQDSLSRSV